MTGRGQRGGGPAGAAPEWETVVGLEVHVQLSTATKAFCGCAVTFGEPPNTRTCPVCAGHPGALPVPNGEMVARALTLGAALGSRVRTRSLFARKSYFYPDLPKGYQITQYDTPLCEGGRLEWEGPGGAPRGVDLVRVHLEEDAGKTLHDAKNGRSLVDLNRAGVPLLEVVTEPWVGDGADAAAALRALRTLVRWLGLSDGDMQAGSLRCDANVSVRPRGSAQLGVRAEVKNLNSFRFLQRAVDHEAARQATRLAAGRPVVQETRLFDEASGTTRAMRGKEEAEDYRYLPEPDLPPLEIAEAEIARARAALPELPLARRRRLVEALGVALDDARVLTEDRALGDLLEAVVADYDGPAARAAAFVVNEVLREAQVRGRAPTDLPLAPEALARLLARVDEGRLSFSAAKRVLGALADGDPDPDAAIERLGLAQISDPAALRGAAEAVLAEHPAEVARYRAGQRGLLGFLMGRLMARTAGRAHPALAREILEDLLAGP